MQGRRKQESRGYWVSALVMGSERAAENVFGRVGLAAALVIALATGLWVLFVIVF